MRAAVRAAVERALGSAIARVSAESGGDINESFAVVLAGAHAGSGGRRVFVKTHAAAPPGMFAAEARGLEWLGSAQCLRVPLVLAVEASFLALEYLESGARRRDFDEELGRGLAALHLSGAPAFGFESGNFVGRLPQSNRPHPTWHEFYRDERLLPQLALARELGRATRAMERGFERLWPRLETLLGPAEPPARLHGDLWGGNLHVGPEGEPCLIDPAVYGGHREVDLAMMRLFGGFSPRVFAAYDEAYPLAAGHGERVRVYQLYPLMVHVNHFGGSYVASVEQTLAALV